MSVEGQDRAFRYRAVGQDGRRVADRLRASDPVAAVRQLESRGLIVTEIAADTPRGRDGGGARRDLKLSERVLVMRQLALMLRAGVTLLEALETVSEGLRPARAREQFAALAAALRRGTAFGDALQVHAPGFPAYVYAMIRVGEASGRIAEVLAGAAEQMAYEDRLRRDVINALTYPAFLAVAGVSAVAFIFVEIVPRFAAMVGPGRGSAPWISRAVFGLGQFVNAHALLLGIVLAAAIGLLALVAARPDGRQALYDLARRAPLVGGVLRAREISLWARLISLSLANGVALLPAAALARQGAPAGAFRQGLEAVENDLRAGLAIDVAAGRHTPLTAMDLSLLRAGQRSGALADMFGHMAAGYDERLRDDVKRITALLEPLAIALIAGVVGVVALALVMALASVYDTVY